MTIELKVPNVGESVQEVEIGTWLKKKGDPVRRDEVIVEIETDKATVELPAPADGTLLEIRMDTGASAAPGDVIGAMEEGDVPSEEAAPTRPKQEEKKKDEKGEEKEKEPAATSERPARVMPAARRLLEEHGLDAGAVEPTGPGGRILKEDVRRALDRGEEPAARREGKGERRVRMSLLRRRIAASLVEAQQRAALLTTFNEIDMSVVLRTREELGAAFEKTHGVKLGFMGFFVKACVGALDLFPEVGAEVQGEDVVYHDRKDIGIAVSTERGLVVPVVRGADAMTLAGIERTIGDLAARARESRIGPDELAGGTFTITNGGVFGSLLSTPIVNPPQSGILGMHAIEERPVVRAGQVVVRPCMYVALTYDHRIVDGREAVLFLRTVKESVENPQRILLEI
jgi:2-oxoglutarate dehydrogenase E2 component (dihydrolipoamide succinyltransferase)